MHWNRWTTYSGFGGRLAPESVAAFDRITHSAGHVVEAIVEHYKDGSIIELRWLGAHHAGLRR